MFAFFSTWWNWALTVVCLERNGAGDRVMTLGQIFNYWTLLMQIAHKVQLEHNSDFLPADQRVSPSSVLQQYDHEMRSRWKSTAASGRPIDFATSTLQIDTYLYATCVNTVKSENKGERKRPLADPGPVELCKNFLRGTCKFGSRCKFSHETSDRRPRDDPLLKRPRTR